MNKTATFYFLARSLAECIEAHKVLTVFNSKKEARTRRSQLLPDTRDLFQIYKVTIREDRFQ